MDVHPGFFGFIAQVLAQLEHAVARDAGKNAAVEDGRDDPAVLIDEHHVHRAHFLNVALMHAIQPQHLRIADVLGVHAGQNAGRVVAAGLGKADAAAHGAHIGILHIDAHRSQARSVVSAGRRQNDIVQIRAGGGYAQMIVGSDHRGADVEGGALLMGGPFLVHVQKRQQRFKAVLHRKRRHAHALSAAGKAFKIGAGAEEVEAALRRAVALEALKDLLSIVQHLAGRVQRKVAVRHDAGVVPALAVGVVDHKHMVGEDVAKAQLALIGRLVFQIPGQIHLYVHTASSSTSSCIPKESKIISAPRR